MAIHQASKNIPAITRANFFISSSESDMKLLYTFLLSYATLLGQTCASQMSATSINLGNIPSYGPRQPAYDDGTSNNRSFQLTPSGGGAWSISGQSFVPNIQPVVYSSTGTTSGTGNANILFYMYNASDQVAPTSLTGNIQFTLPGPSGPQTCTLSLTATIVARNPTTCTNNAGVSDSSIGTNSAPWYQCADTVQPSAIGSLPGGSNLMPAVGSSINLPVYGSKLWNMTGTGYESYYSSVPAMNSDDTALFVTGPSGTPHLISFPGGVDHTLTFSPLPAGAFPIFWYWTSNNTALYTYQNTLQQVVFNLSAGTITSTTQVYSFSGATSLSNGYTDGITPDGYIAMVTDKDHSGSTAHPNICLIRISDFHDFCRDASLESPYVPMNGFNFVMASRGFSSVTGRRYVFLNNAMYQTGDNYGAEYYMAAGDTALSFYKYFGAQPNIENGNAASQTSQACPQSYGIAEACLDPNAHAHTVQSPAGHQYYVPVVNVNETVGNKAAAYLVDFDGSATGQTLASQSGGSFNWFPTYAPTAPAALEAGCSGQWCLISYSAIATSWKVTNAVTSGSTIVLTLDGAPGSGLVTGNAAYVGSVGGCTNANGAFASVTVSGSTVTLPGVTCNASYTASTGGIFKNVYGAASPYQGELDAIRINDSGVPVETHRIGTALAVAFNDSYTIENYWEQGQCGLSMSLKYAVCNSNGGVIDARRVVVLETGISAPGSIFAGQNLLNGKNVIQ